MSSLLALLPLAEKAIERLFPDKQAQENARLKLMELEQQGNMQALQAYVQLLLAQLEVNKEEAKSGRLWVSGARPGILWICGAGLAWNFIVNPLIAWGGFLAGYDLTGAPVLDTGELTTILLGLLGLSGMRSFEKFKGVARDAL